MSYTFRINLVNATLLRCGGQSCCDVAFQNISEWILVRVLIWQRQLNNIEKVWNVIRRKSSIYGYNENYKFSLIFKRDKIIILDLFWTLTKITQKIANWTEVAQTGSPVENFNKKPNNAKKRPEKGQTDCLKARKKPNFICGIAFPFPQKASKLQEYEKKILRN